MAKVVFQPLDKTAEFDVTSLRYRGHGKRGSLLDVALNFGIPLAHVCGGNAACTTCHVIVTKGDELLGEMEDAEQDRLEMTAGVTLHSRLACQAVLVRDGEVVVEVPSWSRNGESRGDL